jgi:hypothetical protein
VKKSREYSAEEKAARSKFTTEKLLWLDAMVLDRRLSASARVYALYIALRINWETGITFVSDGTVSDETGMSTTTISDVRKVLVETKWLEVSRRNRGSTYTFRMSPVNVNGMLDIRIAKREMRAEARRRKARTPHIEGLTQKGPPKIGDLNSKPLAKTG